MFRESSKVVDSSIPQPHYGSQLCIDNLGISGRGRRGERFVVKDCSEEDETLRPRRMLETQKAAGNSVRLLMQPPLKQLRP